MIAVVLTALLTPKWFVKSISNRPLVHERYVIFDKRSGYYLSSFPPCSCGYSLTLTRDRRVVWENEQSGKLPKPSYQSLEHLRKSGELSLKNSLGVRIGDTPNRVRGLLGNPHSITEAGLIATYLYKFEEPKEDGYMHYQTYSFKNGKLIEMTISKDL